MDLRGRTYLVSNHSLRNVGFSKLEQRVETANIFGSLGVVDKPKRVLKGLHTHPMSQNSHLQEGFVSHYHIILLGKIAIRPKNGKIRGRECLVLLRTLIRMDLIPERVLEKELVNTFDSII
jgi:hypothetical protein